MRRLDIFLLLFAALVGAELLVFNDTTGLPVCADQCSVLYAAQYECDSAPEPEQVKCFCKSNLVWWGQDCWTGCDDVCVDEAGRKRVRDWMEATCNSSEKDDKRRDNENSTGPYIIMDPSQTESDVAENAAAQATRVREWWSRNYAFFVLAFLVVTIPIICYAVAIPLRRWCKRQLISRRPRSGAYMEDISPYTSVFASTGSRHSEQHYVVTTSSGQIPEHTISIPQAAIGPVVESSIRQDSWEARVRQDSWEARVRQDSWEARVRDQFESRKSLVERIKFWKR